MDKDRPKAFDSYKNSIWNRALMQIMAAAQVKTGSNRDGVGYKKKPIESPETILILTGRFMDITSKELKEINQEVVESVKILRQNFEDSRIAFDMLEPELLKTTKRIRDFRMNVALEMQKSLSVMQDVRKFFLDKEYKDEIERLERFVALAERMKALINDGTMDAICDSVLKLSVK